MPTEKLLLGFCQVDITWCSEGWMFLCWQWILGFFFDLLLGRFNVAHFGHPLVFAKGRFEVGRFRTVTDGLFL